MNTKTFIFIAGCIICFGLSVFIWFEIPFTKFLFSMIAGAMGFAFSPVFLIMSIISSKIIGEQKFQSVLLNIYMSLISNISIISLFSVNKNAIITLVIIALLLFIAIEAWLRNKKTTLTEVSGYSINLRYWFLLFLINPILFLLS